MTGTSIRNGLYRLPFGRRGSLRRRYNFRLPNDGAVDKLILDDSHAPVPAGWVVVHVGGPSVDVKLTLRLTAANGSVHDIQLKRGGRGGSTNLIRLPDAVGEVALRSHAGSSGIGAAADAALPALDELVLREIGPAEAMLRAVFAGGWRQIVLRLRQISVALRRSGIGGALDDIARRHIPSDLPSYQDWIDLYDRPNIGQVAGLRERAAALRSKPKFSVLVDANDPQGRGLIDTIESVRAQLYENWELCLVYRHSLELAWRTVLQRQAVADSRIRLCPHSTTDATNDAVSLASGAYIALVRHDDVLAPHSLLMMAEAIEAHPDADLLYSDEDLIDENGRRCNAYFKPDFNPELLHTQNFVSHLGVYRAQLVRDLGGFHSDFAAGQDYDLALRVTAATRQPVIHVPHVLYHRRLDRRRQTSVDWQAEDATQAAQQPAAIPRECLGVAPGLGRYRRVLYPPPVTWPRVSAIVPTRDHADVLRTCIDGLLDGTDYPALDITIVDNDSIRPETRAYFDAVSLRGVQVLPYPGPFNFSAINNAAAAGARGEILLLMNNDVSVSDPGWLREMVTLMLRADVGAVGARLLYADGSLQHGGVVLGLGGVAGHLHRGADADDGGYFGHLHVVREVSCCTAACLTVWAKTFAEVGGLDADNLPIAFNDVDLCIRLRAAGRRILWTPFATLTHWESKSRGSDHLPDRIQHFSAEVAYMKARWGPQLQSDPFFSANLSLDHNIPTLCFPPRVPRPWDGAQAASRPPREHMVAAETSERPLKPEVGSSSADVA